MVVVPTSMAIFLLVLECASVDETVVSARISICHWPHSSTSGSRARAWHASRQPEASSSELKAVPSASVTGSAPESTRTPQPPHCPSPPQGNSKPCAARLATRGPPRGTSTSTESGSRRIRTWAGSLAAESTRSEVIRHPQCRRRAWRALERPVERRESRPRPTDHESAARGAKGSPAHRSNVQPCLAASARASIFADIVGVDARRNISKPGVMTAESGKLIV